MCCEGGPGAKVVWHVDLPAGPAAWWQLGISDAVQAEI